MVFFLRADNMEETWKVFDEKVRLGKYLKRSILRLKKR
jgi:hypothetical protein